MKLEIIVSRNKEIHFIGSSAGIQEDNESLVIPIEIPHYADTLDVTESTVELIITNTKYTDIMIMNVITRQKRYYIDWTVLRKHLIPDRMTVQLRVSDVSQGQEWRSEVLQLNVLRSEVGNQIPVYRISMSILDDHERRITFLEDGYREINEDYTELSGRVDTLESNSKWKEYN